MEAVGVEPTSEKAYRKEATCVSGSVVFVRARIETGKTGAA